MRQKSLLSKLVPQTSIQLTESNNFINFNDLKIEGVGLSSFEKDLVRKFGKPLKVRNNGSEYNCSDEDSKTLFYKDFKKNILVLRLSFGLVRDRIGHNSIKHLVRRPQVEPRKQRLVSLNSISTRSMRRKYASHSCEGWSPP